MIGTSAFRLQEFQMAMMPALEWPASSSGSDHKRPEKKFNRKGGQHGRSGLEGLVIEVEDS